MRKVGQRLTAFDTRAEEIDQRVALTVTEDAIVSVRGDRISRPGNEKDNGSGLIVRVVRAMTVIQVGTLEPVGHPVNCLGSGRTALQSVRLIVVWKHPASSHRNAHDSPTTGGSTARLWDN